ncbi:MAG: AbrB/MazE/SpoVT family DNA-binding domain-containing protein [Chloroflexi bacterium]|nr:AbrB/MazE/SpoVT family DNA-binding domain-containing protein [Chloroflexota bacterium]
MSVVTLSTKGQIVLPKEVRDALDLREGDYMRLTVEGGQIVLERLQRQRQRDWRRWRGHLAGTRSLQEYLAEKAGEVES